MNLRTALAVISLLVTVIGTIASIRDCRAFPFAIYGGIIFISLLIERWRYNAMSQTRQPGEIAIGEHFIDPETETVMEVVYNEKTGERKYVSVSEPNGRRSAEIPSKVNTDVNGHI